jgi:hypothetical protein
MHKVVERLESILGQGPQLAPERFLWPAITITRRRKSQVGAFRVLGQACCFGSLLEPPPCLATRSPAKQVRSYPDPRSFASHHIAPQIPE